MMTTDHVLIELIGTPVGALCCRRAEVVAALRFAGSVRAGAVVVEFDRVWLAWRFKTLLATWSHLRKDLVAVPPVAGRGTRFLVTVGGCGEVVVSAGILAAGRVLPPRSPLWTPVTSCDSVSMWRGAFLTRGRLHRGDDRLVVEVRCPDQVAATTLVGLARRAGLFAHQVARGGSLFVVVEDIRALLRWIGAPRCTEAQRRGARGYDLWVASSPVMDVVSVGRALDVLGPQAPVDLAAVGRLRVDHPAATYGQLGQWMTPPVPASTVLRRLRRLLSLARKHGARP